VQAIKKRRNFKSCHARVPSTVLAELDRDKTKNNKDAAAIQMAAKQTASLSIGAKN